MNMTYRPLIVRLGVLVGIIAVSGIVALFPKKAAVNPDPNHTHADFAVWINGTQWDFAQQKYMSDAQKEEVTFRLVETASAHGGHEEGATIPERQYIHLHDGNGSVIHLHKPGFTLRHFFTSLGWQMSNTCLETDTHVRHCNETGDRKWRMFVNDKEEIMNPYYEVKDLDRILLTYGSSKEAMLTQLTALTDTACLYSRTCPERGDPPAENCIADPTVPCVAL